MNTFEELNIQELNHTTGGMQDKSILDDCLV
ncbi:bacteriocin [Marinifilum sp. N1E240]|nr:bacteriocin [Marinifilum sp. N1E240]MPQ48487.1 bacteriocin [Marinifilum sp. N1E240]